MPPAPNPNAQRRNARIGPRVLPKSGRQGPIPDCPLETPTMSELEMWDRLWNRQPQAVVWEEMELYDEVARYVRLYLRSVAPTVGQMVHGQVTTLANQLGLTARGMQQLMWTVEETTEKPQEGNVVNARERFKLTG